ncbi:lipopolysaccharide assembly protein [Roseimicrobium gellanilyticum]|uniref:Lipopolysaccharide assembly protein n=2 Tax=Roseimicrobium gellanilyticum TaxID=748857 RepID=A0A366HP21_9BACT|nr:lipopolysaccharide assembly protein [Roseimicrobium gellanilyticum]
MTGSHRRSSRHIHGINSPATTRLPKQRMNKLALFLAPLALSLLTNCAGYQLGASKPHQMSNVTKLAVPTFKNDTLEPRLEVLVTNALIKKLQADGAYQIVPRGEADAVLNATITDIERSQFRAVRSNTLRSSELLMRLRIDYTVDSSAGEQLLKGQVQGASNIVIDPSLQITERQALADAAERLSISMASAVSEGW